MADFPGMGKFGKTQDYVEDDDRNTLQKVSFSYYLFSGLSLITLLYCVEQQ